MCSSDLKNFNGACLRFFWLALAISLVMNYNLSLLVFSCAFDVIVSLRILLL